MTDFKQIILSRLLDKYEHSKSFREPGSPTSRRIFLHPGRSDFPEYDIEKPGVRETANSVILELAASGLAGFSWLRFEEGNIIDRIWLLPHSLGEAYRAVSRKPRHQVLASLAEQVAALNAALKTGLSKDVPPDNWISRFLQDVSETMQNKGSVSGCLPRDEEQARAILTALAGIHEIFHSGSGEGLERVFSNRWYGDSKYFEKNVRARLVRILKDYATAEGSEMAESDLLSLAGLYSSPATVEFKGAFQGLLAGKPVDFSLFPHGVLLNAPTVRDLQITSLGPVKKVLFIENKANYTDWIIKNTDETLLTLFHGGFYSPLKGMFFQKIHDAAAGRCDCGRRISGQEPHIEFLHWGDIDLGGFLMFQRLKAQIAGCLKPFRMDVETYRPLQHSGSMFDARYARKLDLLLQDSAYAEFHDLIRLMLASGIRLEQEALLWANSRSDG
ncbi:MAG TPA: hypothetical protein DD727_03765 [Clostridiales bacterium]|nr:hypothetical protein [Clostridiales bacterium]